MISGICGMLVMECALTQTYRSKIMQENQVLERTTANS